jgi:hypothetical protein
MSVNTASVTGTAADVRSIAIGINLAARSACHKIHRGHDEQNQRQEFQDVFHKSPKGCNIGRVQ